jgi:hypothetical protein
MFVRDLHVGLAVATVGAFVVVAGEAATRAVAARPPGRFATAISAVAMIAVGMTAAGGLAMLVRGEHPSEPLHFVYAVVAFVLVPVGDTLTETSQPRRRAVARVVAAIVALGVVARLFGTG